MRHTFPPVFPGPLVHVENFSTTPPPFFLFSSSECGISYPRPFIPLPSPLLRSLHRFHSPFSVPPSPSWTALPRRRTGSPRSISFQLRANRGFRGQASMVHRLFVATFPLATGYFIISLRCGKLTPLAVHPFFNDCSQRCFGFFFSSQSWTLRIDTCVKGIGFRQL